MFELPASLFIEIKYYLASTKDLISSGSFSCLSMQWALQTGTCTDAVERRLLCPLILLLFFQVTSWAWCSWLCRVSTWLNCTCTSWLLCCSSLVTRFQGINSFSIVKTHRKRFPGSDSSTVSLASNMNICHFLATTIGLISFYHKYYIFFI